MLEPRPAREWRVPVRRPDDLLVFDLLFDNLELAQGKKGPQLERRVEPARALLIVEFPPQSFGEEAYQIAEPDFKEPLRRPLPSSRIRMSGPSRLAFAMPADAKPLLFTLDAVLEAMRTWPMQLAATALPDPDLIRGRWLIEAVTSQALETAFTGLSGALEELAGAKGVAAAIEEAGQRVAEHAAGGLSSTAQEALRRGDATAMQREIEELENRYPALRKGPARQAGIAALSLASARSLAPAAGRVDVGAGLVGELPYLPLLLAPHKPSALTTALELPYRLLLSPIEAARWQHIGKPVVHGTRTELWHTRLRTAPGETGPGTPISNVRAVWSPDYHPNVVGSRLHDSSPKPFRMSLAPLDRRDAREAHGGVRRVHGHGQPYTPRSTRRAGSAVRARRAARRRGQLGAASAGGGSASRSGGTSPTLGRDHTCASSIAAS